MVTTNDVRLLWEHYDEQSRHPFVGASQAKKYASRLRRVLDSANRQRLIMKLPTDGAEFMKIVRGYSDDEYSLLMMTGDVPTNDVYTDEPDEPEPTTCAPVDDPPRVKVKFDKPEARWIVYVDYQQIMKRAGVYVYKDQARAIATALRRNKPAQLADLWAQL